VPTETHGGTSAGHLAAIVASSDDAILSKDREGVITSWNAGAERLYGYTPEEAIGQSIAILIPPERAGEERHILAQVLADQPVDHYETVRVTKEGEHVYVSLSVSPIRASDRTITGAAVIARDISERRRAAERAGRLQELTVALARQLKPEDALDTLLRAAQSGLQADAATVGLVSEDGELIELAGAIGYSNQIEAWQSFPLSAPLPLAEAVRTREAVWSHNSRDLLARYPSLAGAEVRFEALAVVPMVVGDRALGAIALSFERSREFVPEERAFMAAAVQQAAQAFARARLFESERERRERFEFLAEVSELLSQSLDLDETLQRLAFLTVPRLADWCSVQLAEPNGAIRTVVVAHADPERGELAHDLERHYRPDPQAPTGAPHVIRTGEAELYSDIPDEILVAAARDEGQLRLIRELGLRSAVVVPLPGRERILGAITLVAAESGPRYGEDELALAQEVARRAALAVDNALLYRAEHEAAVTLQRALLPDRLPAPANVELAARYIPAGLDLEVGGDWYDAIEHGTDEITLIVGDVAGSGIRAASVMGQLRTALRAIVLEGHSPALALERLDMLMRGFTGPEMATVLQIAVDLRSRVLEYARAGHLPAMLRGADGRVEQLSGGGSGPLGFGVGAGCCQSSATLDPGSTVLLYTDGLVERRHRGIDDGLAQLAEAFAAAPEAPAACIDAIVDSLITDEPDDDVAALAMRA
jgi:PAS domain S-box-containing protein